ncbi:MAG: hypothetical protein GWP19_10650 [Planctomycetia bacterium]|nr:hypothetical protein [Planctomycetia bacterium]
MISKENKIDKTRLFQRIKYMFSSYIEYEPQEDIKVISQYFKYLHSHIDLFRGRILLDQEILGVFDAISLLLIDRLMLYPDTVQKEVNIIMKEADLSNFFGIYSGLSTSEQSMIRFKRTFGIFANSYLRQIFGSGFSSELVGLPSDRLHIVKVALHRLSNILEYTSGIELLDYDTEYTTYKEHYDPSIIDKQKIIALIELIRLQCNVIPDTELKEHFQQKINKLENEIKKKNPRWGRIISGFFFLLGIVANVKTVAPETYNNLHNSIEKVIVILHEDAQTNQKTDSPTSLPLYSSDKAIIQTNPKKENRKRDEEEDDR